MLQNSLVYRQDETQISFFILFLQFDVVGWVF